MEISILPETSIGEVLKYVELNIKTKNCSIEAGVRCFCAHIELTNPINIWIIKFSENLVVLCFNWSVWGGIL